MRNSKSKAAFGLVCLGLLASSVAFGPGAWASFIGKPGGGGAVALSAAEMNRRTVQSIATGAPVKIAFDEVGFEAGIAISADATNDRFDINLDGIYIVRASWGSEDLEDAAQMRAMIYVNAVEVRRSENLSPVNTGDPGAGVEQMLDLAAGVQVEFYVEHDNTGAMNSDTAVALRPSMFVYRLGDRPIPPPGVDDLKLETFTANGNWVAPAGVTSAWVEAWGGGGGGSTNTGGGGGGAYAATILTVVPTTSYAIVIGQGVSGVDGGDTTFDATIIVAKGGLSGANGGTGGQAAASTGVTKYDGGDGALGTGLRAGGGGAGDSGAGSGTTGGSTNGGWTQANREGIFMAAGGGSTTAGAGERGSDGQVRITYDFPAEAGYPYVVARSWNNGPASFSHPITMPSGITASDLLVIIIQIKSTGATNVMTIAAGGWTKVGQGDNDSDCSLAVFYKSAAGGDTATVASATSARSTHQVFRIERGGVPTASFAESLGAGDPPSHTSPAGVAKHLWLATVAYENQTVDSNEISAPPTFYDAMLMQPGQQSAGGAQAVYGVVSQRSLTAETENPGPYTADSNQTVGATISIPYL